MKGGFHGETNEVFLNYLQLYTTLFIISVDKDQLIEFVSVAHTLMQKSESPKTGNYT